MSIELIGRSLGRYHILERLGEGGMATVYKAYDTRLERDVAVKIIRREAFPPEQLDRILKRFEREAKSLAKLSHPNIVGVIDFGDYEGSPYLVMEFLPSGTLKQRIGKPIPWQEAARLLLPVARALQFAHGRGIVHRDIKPSNILITESGEPMLADFGVAKILESGEAATLTGTGIGVGTPEYMAPEQWTGNVSARSDIYSLGIVFYEMITGRKPYTADTPAAVLLKQATEPLPRPGKFTPGLPDAVEKFLLKTLAKKPDDRYRTMGEMAESLEATLGIGPKPPQIKEKPQISDSRISKSGVLPSDRGGQSVDQESNKKQNKSLMEPTPIEKPSSQDKAKAAPTKGIPVKIPRLLAIIGVALAVLLCLGGTTAAGIYKFSYKTPTPTPMPTSTPTFDIPKEEKRYFIAAYVWDYLDTDPDSLQMLCGIAIAPDRSIYVTDIFKNRIMHLDSSGKLLQAWGSYSGPEADQAENGTFNEPWGIAIGPDGSVYVADTWNHRIQKFSRDGTFLSAWGTFTRTEPEFQLYGPRAIVVDSEGNVFVADTGNKRINVYDSDGGFLYFIGGPGSGPGYFDEPVGLAFGSENRLFIADSWNARIQVFQEGIFGWKYLTEWSTGGLNIEDTYAKPYLAASSDGRVWLTDPGSNQVRVYTNDGGFLFSFGQFGDDSSSFNRPIGIAADADGRILVADSGNNRIMVFNNT